MSTTSKAALMPSVAHLQNRLLLPNKLRDQWNISFPSSFLFLSSARRGCCASVLLYVLQRTMEAHSILIIFISTYLPPLIKG